MRLILNNNGEEAVLGSFGGHVGLVFAAFPGLVFRIPLEHGKGGVSEAARAPAREQNRPKTNEDCSKIKFFDLSSWKRFGRNCGEVSEVPGALNLCWRVNGKRVKIDQLWEREEWSVT